MEQGDAPERAENEGQGMILGGLRAQLQGQAAAAQTTWNAIEYQPAAPLADEELQFLQAKKHKREKEEDTATLKRCKSDEQSNEKEQFEANEALPTEETTVVGLFRGPVAPYIGKACSGYIKHPVEMISVTENYGVLEDEHAYHDHGGPIRGILQYSNLDYQEVRAAFPEKSTLTAPCGFGENICTDGWMCTKTVCIGDVYQIGTVEAVVSMPRYPCYKIDHKHGKGVQKYVLQHALSGWFYRVTKPGDVKVGDKIKLLRRPHPKMTIHYLQTGLYAPQVNKTKDREFLQTVISMDALAPKHWKDEAEKLLKKLDEKK